MAASASDYFKKGARKWVGQIGSGGVATAAVTTIPLASSTGLPTDTGVEVVINRVDSNGTATPTSEETVVGVVSGNNLISCTRGVEGTAQAHAAGDVVECLFTADNWNDAVDGLLVEHAQDGEHDVSGGIKLVEINDTNGNEEIKFTATASAVNELTIANAAANNDVTISTTGNDTNIDLAISPKGTGKIVAGKTEFQNQAYFDAEVDNGNSSTADTIDWTTGNKQKSTMTDDCTYTFTAPTGPCNLILKLVQDGTGSRTATWPATVKWPSGTAPTLTTTASAVDIISFYWDGTNYHGNSSLAFAVPA